MSAVLTIQKQVPAYLLTRDRKRFACGPPKVEALIRCPECKHIMLYRSMGFVCQTSLTHTGIVPVWPTLAERVARVLKVRISNEPPRSQDRKLRRMLLFLRRRSVWMQRLQLDEGAITDA